MKKSKSAAGGKQHYEEHAEAIAAPIAEQFGIRIYDVEYVREGEEFYLNVYIDKDGGVTIDDCENVSRLLSDALDKDDPIPDAYTLIVSSPGLGRALTKDRHLQQSIGQDVEIHLYKPHAGTGEKDIRGELLEFDDTQIVLMAEPPVPAKGKGKGKGKKKGSDKNGKNAAKKAVDEAAAALVEDIENAGNAENIAEMPAAPQTAPEDADSAVTARKEQADESGRQRLTVGRREIASIRLAFDF